jgi:hypothetical protein
MGMKEDAVRQAMKRGVSTGLALRASRVAGVPLERLLDRSWLPPGACPHCGMLPDDPPPQRR